MAKFDDGDSTPASVDNDFLPHIDPFSVLNTTKGGWMKRKKYWMTKGIAGQLGRVEEASKDSDTEFGDAFSSNLDGHGTDMRQKYKEREVLGDGGEVTQDHLFTRPNKAARVKRKNTGTSVFDPVLCELMFRWFVPPGGRILDPFAGESTKGIVAAMLGYEYVGIELRQTQVEENERQAAAMNVSPKWICGDSAEIEDILDREEESNFDFLFTSPPYYDLEVYSDSSSDGSTFGSYSDFMSWYSNIFRAATSFVKKKRLVAVKVGEVRNPKTGEYYGFVPDNVQVFTEDCGLYYFNEMILVTPLGSLMLRTPRQFSSGRKIGKNHQNILMFSTSKPNELKGVLPYEYKSA